MIVSSNLSSPLKEYTLMGGVTVQDKTDGLAKVIFSEFHSQICQMPTYKITIDDKPLVYYPYFYSYKMHELLFSNSIKITLEKIEDLIHITEEDPTGTSEVYVNSEIHDNNITRTVTIIQPSKSLSSYYGLIALSAIAIVLFVRALK